MKSLLIPGPPEYLPVLLDELALWGLDVIIGIKSWSDTVLNAVEGDALYAPRQTTHYVRTLYTRAGSGKTSWGNTRLRVASARRSSARFR